MEPQTFITAATNILAAGISFVPTGKDKKPIVSTWKPLQKRFPTPQEMKGWSTSKGLFGIAVIAGQISGNIQTFDIDAKYDLTGSLMDGFCALVKEHSSELFKKLVIAKTTNGGLHIIARVSSEVTQGNQKLAVRSTTEAERRQTYEKEIAAGADEKTAGIRAENDKIRVLVETRGESGFFVVQPTPGYEFIQGDLSLIQVITKSEYELLLTIARSFDEMPIRDEPQPAKTESKKQSGELSPFEDYNNRADIPALLGQHGWKYVYRQGDRLHFLRPGQTNSKTSANYHTTKRIFFVFSSSTEFESEKGYSPVQVYAQLGHGGDLRAASKALYAADYGSRHAPNVSVEQAHNENSEVDDEPLEIKLPELSEKALYGLAGDFVRAVTPYTEAHRAALLFQFLVVFGCVAGKDAYFHAGAKQYLNIFTLLIGKTGRQGRKGTSLDNVNSLFEIVSNEFITTRTLSTLASGQGLISQVADAKYKTDEHGVRERDDKGKEVLLNVGVADKRLLIRAEEFGAVMKLQGAEGSILKDTLCVAWDGKPLSNPTRHYSERCANPHISLIGHITPFEFSQLLSDVDLTNGYFNRILLAYVWRERRLAEGSEIPQKTLNQLAIKTKKALDFAKIPRTYRRDERAQEWWKNFYYSLDECHDVGLIAEVLARAETQVVRLSLLFAVMDSSEIITREHMEAAKAVFDYSQQSTNFIFRGRTGDKTTDKILDALRASSPNGILQRDLYALFQNNVLKSKIESTLLMLLEAQMVRSEKIPNESGKGRHGVHWFAVPRTTQTNETNETNKCNKETNEIINSFHSPSPTENKREVFEI